jgi:asparagine synthetase B (glutamine-hydrolysing)
MTGPGGASLGWTSRAGVDAIDVASGMVFGRAEGIEAIPRLRRNSPRANVASVLRSQVRSALLEAPCLVSFSGGRDSSAVLALAADVARREGLPLPIPATIRFPTADGTDESGWQRQVLRHLDLEQDWVVASVTGEFDAVGELALEGLRAHGLMYPYNVHFQVPLLQAARGGSLVTGVGGDELFSEVQWWGEAVALVGNGQNVSPRLLARSSARGMPRAARRFLLQRHFRFPLAWLRAEGQRAVERRYAEWLADQDLRYAAALSDWWWPSRYLQLGLASLHNLAGQHGTRLIQPFGEPEVLAALAAHRPVSGFQSRTEAMRLLFGSLLPPTVIRRESKADFTSVLFGEHTREFSRRWAGEGVDHLNVDWRVVQAQIRDGRHDGRVLLQVQAGRLAADG